MWVHLNPTYLYSVMEPQIINQSNPFINADKFPPNKISVQSIQQSTIFEWVSNPRTCDFQEDHYDLAHSDETLGGPHMRKKGVREVTTRAHLRFPP